MAEKLIEILPTAAGYDAWSAIYDVEDNPLIALEEEHVARQLGPVSGLAVLDVGCGTGRHALRLSAQGAVATGVDFSEGMLGRAREKSGADAVRFVSHDLGQPLPFADGAFDRLVSGLVLEHIVDLPAFFRELRRVLRPGGFMVISAMHPAMMLRGVTAHFTDPTTGHDIHPAGRPNQISDYVMGALAAGLALDHLSEHAVDGALVARCPRAEKYLGWPMLLLMRLS